jgi:hypothetical protein
VVGLSPSAQDSVHFADLLGDLKRGIRRIARFLEVDPPANAWLTIMRNSSFAEMKVHGPAQALSLLFRIRLRFIAH